MHAMATRAGLLASARRGKAVLRIESERPIERSSLLELGDWVDGYPRSMIDAGYTD